MRSALKAALVVLLGIIVVIISAAIGYGIGFDAGEGSIDCTKGEVLSIKVTNADGLGNGTHQLDIGNCDRIDEAAFIAAVNALAGSTATTTTAACRFSYSHTYAGSHTASTPAAIDG